MVNLCSIFCLTIAFFVCLIYASEVYREDCPVPHYYKVSEMKPKDAFDIEKMKFIAEEGLIDGLMILRNLPANHGIVVEVAQVAASKGHLEFLREMYSMGLLQECCSPAILDAASNGHTECLEFLVRRLGTKYLSYEDSFGLMPIHLAAAKSQNPDTLRTIIALYPYYKPRFSCFRTSNVISPLHEAIKNGMQDNARILLDNFPELINFKDTLGNTVIHLAAEYYDISMLEMLLTFAPPEIISARNYEGDTALHLGQSYVSCYEKHALLMRTGLFTGMERNNKGQTPIGAYRRTHDLKNSSTRIKLIEIFNLQTEEEFNEALRIVPTEEPRKFGFFF